MKRVVIWIVLLIVGISGQLFAADYDVFYVDASKPDNSGAGTNWATAVRDIQAAVDLGGSSDYIKIWVTNGVYRYGGGVSDVDSGTMSNRVSLNVGQDYWVIEAVNKGFGDTVIEGAPDPGTGGNGPNAIRCFHGNKGSATSTKTVWLKGFTLTNGYTKTSGGTYDEAGGGAYDAKLSHCWLSGNHADDYGGAIAVCQVYSSELFNNSAGTAGGAAYSSLIYSSTIYSNQASRGGALYKGSCHDSVISNNTATSRAGAIYSGAEAYNCTIVNNHSDGHSGVMARDCIASNCVMRGNTAPYGSVVYEYSGYHALLQNCLLTANVANGTKGSVTRGYVTLVNCTVVSNEMTSSDNPVGAIYGDGGYTYVTNCIIVDNYNSALGIETNYSDLGGIDYCLTAPLPSGGTGNITGNPLFRDAANGDYHFAKNNNSPAIDAGTDTGLADDLDDITRPQDGDNDGTAGYDIGCYEHVYVRPKGSVVVIN